MRNPVFKTCDSHNPADVSCDDVGPALRQLGNRVLDGCQRGHCLIFSMQPLCHCPPFIGNLEDKFCGGICESKRAESFPLLPSKKYTRDKNSPLPPRLFLP